MVRNRSNVKREAAPGGTLEPGLFLQVYVVSQLVGRVVAEQVAAAGLSATEHAVHSSIAALGSVTPTDLARRLGLPATTLSATIAQLVKRDELRRARNPADGRSYVLELSPRGRRTHDRAAGAAHAAKERVAEGLGTAEGRILDALRQLEEALRSELAEPE